MSSSNPISSVASLVSNTNNNGKADEFHINEDEARSIFEQSLSRASNQQCITVDSIHRTYHQYPNKLAFTSSVVRQGLDQFQKTLLQQDNTTGMLSEDDFVRGLRRFEELIKGSEIRDDILQEIESLAVQIAGHDPASFSDLLHLPDVLNTQEIEGIMASMEGKQVQNSTNSNILSPTPNNQINNYRGSLSTTMPMPTSSPSGKITSASIKRVSTLSSTAPR